MLFLAIWPVDLLNITTASPTQYEWGLEQPKIVNTKQLAVKF